MNEPPYPRILVACIGNMFLGDDGFGCEVARTLAGMSLPPGARVIDFGIRGFDLAYALLEPYTAVILVDAVARGLSPGTVSVLQPVHADDVSGAQALIDPHSVDPARVMALARTMGEITAEIYIIGCEPLDFGDELEGRMGLSEPVRAAVPEAARTVVELMSRVRNADAVLEA